MEKIVDVLIVGAGISGIGIAAHLAKNSPQRQFEIIERRDSIGGTWDLFRYPGIRSDSDMSTFGFNFKPWRSANVLAAGLAIKGYLGEVVDEFDLKKKFILSIAYLQPIMIQPRKNGLSKLKMSIRKSKHGLRILSLVVRVIIIMIMALNLIFQIRIFSKVNLFIHSIGLKIWTIQARRW